MAKSKNKIVGNGVSPLGEAVYCWLDKPQPPFKETDSPKYNVTLSMSPDDPKVKAWVKEVKALTSYEKGWPWKIDSESGNLYVRFASYKPVKIVDSHNQPLPSGMFPGSGSEMRIGYAVNEYPGFGGGVNLYLNGVQVTKLEEQRSGVKFDNVDNGYVAETASTHAKGDDSDSPF